MGPGGHVTVEYTVGDAMSFTEFIMALRSVLADHQDCEDVLDRNKLLNLSSTREHPLLPKQRNAEEPRRWLHVKLQVEGDNNTLRTTLLMRDDNLYVLGFINHQGVCFELQDDTNKSEGILGNVYSNVRALEWTVKYASILGVSNTDEVAHKLTEAAEGLGRKFIENAVRVLSRYPTHHAGITLTDREALAGLIIMVCESARINPLLDSVARGWSYKTGFNKQLMERYAWNGNYAKKSGVLLKWKAEGYNEPRNKPHPIDELGAIYLVLNSRAMCSPSQNKAAVGARPDTSSGGRSGGRNGNGNGNGNGGRGGQNNGTGSRRGGRRNNGNTVRGRGTSGRGSNDSGRDYRHKKASNPGSCGSSASKSEDAIASSGVKVDDSQGYDQTGEEDSDQNKEDPNDQDGKTDDDAQGHGRPRVELLAMRADIKVVGTKIIVFDGRRGQIIYRKEEQGQEVIHMHLFQYI
jgi:hypothetical protein